MNIILIRKDIKIFYCNKQSDRRQGTISIDVKIFILIALKEWNV